MKRTSKRKPWPIELGRLISRKRGATLTELMKAFRWEKHGARARVSNLRKHSGLQIESTQSTPRVPGRAEGLTMPRIEFKT